MKPLSSVCNSWLHYEIFCLHTITLAVDILQNLELWDICRWHSYNRRQKKSYSYISTNLSAELPLQHQNTYQKLKACVLFLRTSSKHISWCETWASRLERKEDGNRMKSSASKNRMKFKRWRKPHRLRGSIECIFLKILYMLS